MIDGTRGDTGMSRMTSVKKSGMELVDELGLRVHSRDLVIRIENSSF